MDPIKMDLDLTAQVAAESLPSTADVSVRLSAVMGHTLEERANCHQTSPSHGCSLWLWVLVSCVTLMTSFLIRMG